MQGAEHQVACFGSGQCQTYSFKVTQFSDEIGASLGEMSGPLQQVNSELDQLLLNVEAMPTAMSESMQSVVAFSNSFSDSLTPQIELMGEAMLSSAFDAAVYGDSFKDQLNDFAEAQAKTALISAAIETAKGIALSFINPAQAATHFGAAAAFGVAGVLAGGVALATGGFNGATEASGAEGSAGFGGDASERPDFGRDRDSGGPTETNININLVASPGSRIDRQRDGQAIMGLLRDQGFRGA